MLDELDNLLSGNATEEGDSKVSSRGSKKSAGVGRTKPETKPGERGGGEGRSLSGGGAAVGGDLIIRGADAFRTRTTGLPETIDWALVALEEVRDRETGPAE